MDCECPLYSVNYSVGSFLQFCKNNQQEFPIPGKQKQILADHVATETCIFQLCVVGVKRYFDPYDTRIASHFMLSQS